MQLRPGNKHLKFATRHSELLLGIPVPALIPARPVVMKHSIFKENYKTTFVKPLYRVKFANIKHKKTNDKSNLDGNGSVNASDKKTYSNVKFKDIQKYRILPGGCEVLQHYDVNYGLEDCFYNMPENQKDENSTHNNGSKIKSKTTIEQESNKDNVGIVGPIIYCNLTSWPITQLIFKMIEQFVGLIALSPPETWLRVYPAPAIPGESTSSVVLRCFICQLGLTACLVLWTFVWVFIIQSNEGPYEIEVMESFSKEQDQLVIDLATELRQITPISPKWREAIMKRIEMARRDTMIAAGQGAKLDPGLFWDLSGTLLFTVYVMTALGFGAPVPQTDLGRCLALLYAVVAVPVHVYLMMNAATCAVAHISHVIERCQKNLHGKPEPIRSDKRTLNKDSPNSSVNSDGKTTWRRRKLCRLVSVLTTGHCVPLALVVYYATGVIIFGVFRQSKLSDVMLFPIQFTTGGGLASVESHFRILYGLYVEGAMALLSMAITTARRFSGKSVNNMTVKYRLFAFDHGSQ